MKFAPYFQKLRLRADRAMIREEWIEEAVRHPIREAVQSDGRIRRWTRVAAMGNRILRVHNAFFDRRFRE